MDCEGARSAAAAWAEGREIDPRVLEAARAHAARCGTCGRAVSAVLAIAARGGNRSVSPAAAALADGVAAALDAGRGRYPRWTRLPAAALATAACLACLVGLAFAAEATAAVHVRFVLDAPTASSVVLAGDFSSWGESPLALERKAGGVWERTVRLRKGRAYAYNFVLDGDSWIVDPGAAERVDDGFGGQSGILRL